jgi:uncharacterized protein (TIGR03083 family)
MLDHARIIREESDALAAAGGGGGETPVPGTDWTVADLLDHVGRLTWMFAGRTRKAGGGDFYETVRPEDVDPVTFFRQGAATLCEQLSAADPNAEIKTWAGLVPPAWLWRRMTHELAVHRWDAQAAVGNPEPLAVEVAEDGIDELLEVFVPRADVGPVDGSLHLHATDGDGEWFIETADGLTWTRAHEKGDVAVRGATSDLLLVLWGRIPTTAVEVIGDDAVLTRWRDATRF